MEQRLFCFILFISECLISVVFVEFTIQQNFQKSIYLQEKGNRTSPHKEMKLAIGTGLIFQEIIFYNQNI